MSTEDDEQQQPAPAEDDEQQQPAPAEDDQDEGDGELEGESFPRSYVQRLRERSAGYRTKAKDLEARSAELERALFTERVRALDVLADPADLEFNADLLDDPDKLRDAVDALVSKSPHYRRRGTASNTGAREQHDGSEPVSLLGLMRGGA